MTKIALDETLINALYEPAVHAGDWRPAMDRLRSLLGSADVAFTIFSPLKGIVRVETSGVMLTGEVRAQYARYYFGIDPKNRFFRGARSGYLFNDAERFDDAFVERDAFYQEFSRPIGSRHTLDMLVERTAQRELYLAAMRSAGQGAFNPRAEEQLRLAARHFRRALFLEEKLAALKSTGRLAEAALDRLSFGVVTLDRGGRIAVVNTTARLAFGQGEALRVRDGKLLARSAGAQAALEAAIGGMLHRSDGEAKVVRIPRAEGGCWIVWIAPPGRDGPADPRSDCGAIVLIGDPDGRSALRARDLIGVYGLTEAEAELALALGRGSTLAAVAAERGVRRSTVRSQMLSLLSKMGVHRQADVVRLLASLPCPLMAP